MEAARIKRTLRQLKRQECALRFNQPAAPAKAKLVWDAFFSLTDKKAASRYTFTDLLDMDASAWREAIADYYFDLYQQHAAETGMPSPYHSKEMLSRMGLPPDADTHEIKIRFRELAKTTHPDVGGNHQDFVTLINAYKTLLGE